MLRSKLRLFVLCLLVLSLTACIPKATFGPSKNTDAYLEGRVDVECARSQYQASNSITTNATNSFQVALACVPGQ